MADCTRHLSPQFVRLFSNQLNPKKLNENDRPNEPRNNITKQPIDRTLSTEQKGHQIGTRNSIYSVKTRCDIFVRREWCVRAKRKDWLKRFFGRLDVFLRVGLLR